MWRNNISFQHIIPARLLGFRVSTLQGSTVAWFQGSRYKVSRDFRAPGCQGSSSPRPIVTNNPTIQQSKGWRFIAFNAKFAWPRKDPKGNPKVAWLEGSKVSGFQGCTFPRFEGFKFAKFEGSKIGWFNGSTIPGI